jgi:hypothetical protein
MPLCFLEAPEGIMPAAKTVMMQDAHAALAEAYPFLDDLRIYLREYRAKHVRAIARPSHYFVKQRTEISRLLFPRSSLPSSRAAQIQPHGAVLRPQQKTHRVAAV